MSEKVKKGLSVCSDWRRFGDCDSCPYMDKDNDGDCSLSLIEDAREYIAQLEERIAIMTEGEDNA